MSALFLFCHAWLPHCHMSSLITRQSLTQLYVNNDDSCVTGITDSRWPTYIKRFTTVIKCKMPKKWKYRLKVVQCLMAINLGFRYLDHFVLTRHYQCISVIHTLSFSWYNHTNRTLKWATILPNMPRVATLRYWSLLSLAQKRGRIVPVFSSPLDMSPLIFIRSFESMSMVPISSSSGSNAGLYVISLVKWIPSTLAIGRRSCMSIWKAISTSSALYMNWPFKDGSKPRS